MNVVQKLGTFDKVSREINSLPEPLSRCILDFIQKLLKINQKEAPTDPFRSYLPTGI